MGADIKKRLKMMAASPDSFTNSEWRHRALEAAAEIVRLRGEVADRADDLTTAYMAGRYDGKTIAPAEAKGQTDHKGRPMTYWGGTPGSPQPAGGEAAAWQLQLADALEHFWNAACDGSGPDRSNVIGGMVEGFAAVASRLREYATPPAAPVHLSDEVEEVIVRRAFADIEADVYEDERALTMKRAAELLATHPAAGDKVRVTDEMVDRWCVYAYADMGWPQDFSDEALVSNREWVRKGLEVVLAQPQSGEVS